MNLFCPHPGPEGAWKRRAPPQKKAPATTRPFFLFLPVISLFYLSHSLLSLFLFSLPLSCSLLLFVLPLSPFILLFLYLSLSFLPRSLSLSLSLSSPAIPQNVVLCCRMQDPPNATTEPQLPCLLFLLVLEDAGPRRSLHRRASRSPRCRRHQLEPDRPRGPRHSQRLADALEVILQLAGLQIQFIFGTCGMGDQNK